MKRTVSVIFLLCTILCFLTSCFNGTSLDYSLASEKTVKEDGKETGKNTQEDNIGSIPAKYWGSWIQMDTGKEYYIDSKYVYNSINTNKKYSKSNYNILSFHLDGNNVLSNGSVVLFRKGGDNRSFSLQVTGFSDTIGRAISSGKQGVSGRRQNKNNSADTQTTTSTNNGVISFTNAVADDTQKVSISDGITETSVMVTPTFDGENLGSIPIVESNMYGFKTTFTIDGDEQGICYGNYYKKYTLTLNIENVGTTDCSTSVYNITCENPNLIIQGETSGNFSTIKAGDSKQLKIPVVYGKLDEEYIDVPISFSITDSVYARTWNDTISVRFYKGTVALKINSRNFDSSSYAKLNGFVIYPDGRSKRFTVSAGNTSTVLIPWCERDYILAFSGASAENEMAYSFGFSKKTELADLSGTWKIADINAYESNDSAQTPYRVTDLTKPIKAYLKDGDIDFYKINNKSIEVKFEPVSVISYEVKEYENGNNDGFVTAGESHYLDVKMVNNTNFDLRNVNISLSSISEYVTITRSSYDRGNMQSGYYYSLSDSAYYESGCDMMISYASAGEKAYTDSAFKFTVSSTCPAGIELPFTITFTDSAGNTWTDNLTIPVYGTQAKIELVKEDNYEVKEYENGNNDGLVTPGESHYLDIKFTNSGKSTALGVNVQLSTSTEFVTITRNSYDRGNLQTGYYYTLSDSAYYDSGCDLMTYYASAGEKAYTDSAFKFTVSSTCPAGIELPFTITFTDSAGNIWSDSLSIPVNE